jgi:hypothetical protein
LLFLYRLQEEEAQKSFKFGIINEGVFDFLLLILLIKYFLSFFIIGFSSQMLKKKGRFIRFFFSNYCPKHNFGIF